MDNFSEAELTKMEKQLNKIYKEANKDIQTKWDAYMVKAQAKVDKAKAAYEHAMLFGTPDEMTKASDVYNKAMFNMTLQNKQYQAMVNQITDKLADTNQIALGYLNDKMPGIYCHSYNAFEDQASKIKGYSFELVDESTIEMMVKNGNKSLLPQKTLNIPKDKKWNTKNINSQVLQGILQGEDIGKISKRLMTVTDMNHNSAVRNARTMVTGASNKGRMDSYTKASNSGVIMKKVWVSHPSERTRDWHADLSGVEAEINEPFENDYGEIMYPGDPEAAPANVYNCRCSIRTHILGFKPVEKPIEAESEEGISEYAEKYQGTSVTAQYYSMLNEDKAIGNEFWKALNAEGKPSQVWKDYLAGNTSKEVTNKLDGILAKYKGTGKAIKPSKVKAVEQLPKPNMAMYQDKSMTATFYSVKAENKDLGKEFWSILQAEDNPSVIWQQYISGTAPKEITEKLDKILVQHKGTGAWGKPAATKNLVIKDSLDVDTLADIKDVDINAYKALKNAYFDDDHFVGGPNDYWNAYKTGTIKNSDLDKIFKEKAAKTTKATKVTKTISKADDATKAAVEADDLLKAKEQLAVAQGNLDSLGNKTYSGIWKESVTLSDYEAKAGSIMAKKDYYYHEIESLIKASDAGDIAESVANVKIAKYEKYIDDLTEFESQGKLYIQYEAEYKKAAAEVKKLTPVGERFGPDAYTKARRDNAAWAKNDSQYHTLDKYYDDVAKKVHGARTNAEYEGYYHYTWGSMPFNSPLAGYRGDRYTNFVGVNKVDINVGGYGEKIRGLTSLIEKSTYDQDIWVQSAQGEITLETFLGIKPGTLHNMSLTDAKQFIGVENEIPQFISGAIQKGGGSYNPGDMTFNIYCPSGSEVLYVRSDGRFGKSEKEMILQRGGTYKVTNIYRGKGTHGRDEWIVDLEVHPENGYDKFQQTK